MAKTHAFGAQLDISVDGGSVYTQVASIGDMSGPGVSNEVADVTTHDSPSGEREYVSALGDGGELTLELVWDPEDVLNQDALWDARENKSKWKYKIFYNTTNSANLAFDAFVTNVTPSAPVGEKLSCSVTLKVSGLVVKSETGTPGLPPT